MALRSIKRRPPASSPSRFGGDIVAGIGGTIITGGAGERTQFNAARRDARRAAFAMMREPCARLDLAIGQAKTGRPN
jgi:hypothetical protein